MSVDGNVLTVQMDLTMEGTLSKSGKSLVIASTHGNVSVPDIPSLKIGLNLYEKK
jgi:hypothetical protein